MRNYYRIETGATSGDRVIDCQASFALPENHVLESCTGPFQQDFFGKLTKNSLINFFDLTGMISVKFSVEIKRRLNGH